MREPEGWGDTSGLPRLLILLAIAGQLFILEDIYPVRHCYSTHFTDEQTKADRDAGILLLSTWEMVCYIAP